MHCLAENMHAWIHLPLTKALDSLDGVDAVNTVEKSPVEVVSAVKKIHHNKNHDFEIL